MDRKKNGESGWQQREGKNPPRAWRKLICKGGGITKRLKTKSWGLSLASDFHPLGRQGRGVSLVFPSESVCPAGVQLLPVPVDSALLPSALNCCLTLDLHGKLNYAPKTLIA